MPSLGWIARTTEKEYTSDRNSFSEIPKNNLLCFFLQGFGHTLQVDLATGKLYVDGNDAETGDGGALTEARLRNISSNASLKLHYFQRGYREMNTQSMEEGSSGIEYAVCGWESASDRVFWKIVPGGRVFLHFEKV